MMMLMQIKIMMTIMTMVITMIMAMILVLEMIGITPSIMITALMNVKMMMMTLVKHGGVSILHKWGKKQIKSL